MEGQKIKLRHGGGLLRGGITALIASLPISMIFVVVYRFPIPFGGYSHGLQFIHLVPIAWLFYMSFGGFIVLFFGGALVGYIIEKRTADENKRKTRITIGSIIFTAVAVGFLAILDKIIGPW